MLALKRTNILDMALDLMEKHFFFSHPTGSFGNNAIIFGVDMSSSVHIDNKKGHFNSWKRSNTRIRTAFINCIKNVFD